MSNSPLGKVPDAIVFTAGIGEKSPLKRAKIIKHLKPLGFTLDEERNERNDVRIGEKVFVIPTNEQLMIAQQTLKLLDGGK